MYGGSGISPCARNTASNEPSATRTVRSPCSPSATTSTTSEPSAVASRAPACACFAGFASTRHVS
jgi:hypothetical protein